MDSLWTLTPFGFGKDAPAADLARLHEQLLPHSPLSKLGRRFMERFYYRVLPEDGLIFGAIVHAGTEPAGFSAATLNSDGFMRAALRKRPFLLMCAVAESLVRSPRTLAGSWEAGSIVLDRSTDKPGGPIAELLSLGVLPQFQHGITGLPLASALVSHIHSAFLERGVFTARLIVDADNESAQRFYGRMGWRLNRSAVKGWRRPSLEFVWDAPVRGTRTSGAGMGEKLGRKPEDHAASI